MATNVYDLELLKPGNEVAGPAVIEAVDTTVVVDPDRVFRIDERGSGLVEKLND
ncbi:MAG: hypothetical protein M5U14_10175 [Acidimicrobiia bacterium]|nr:hypothetical protein [Acidimicrobiia bacterium]